MLLTGGEIALYLAIASLLLTAGTLLSMKKPKAAPLDDFLGSSATMGAYIPLVIGRERVAPVFLWVEDATSFNDFGGSPDTPPELGKGGGGVPEPPQIWERAIHAICVGPASKLSKIWQNGELIWSGEISPTSHPSGSSVTLQNAQGSSQSEGTFRIYWGFRDDPLLSGPPALSRFPLATKIVWENKNLGQSRNWPRLEYEVTCPCYSQIASSSSETPLTGNRSKPAYFEWYQETINDSPFRLRGYSPGNPSLGYAATVLPSITFNTASSYNTIILSAHSYLQSQRKLVVMDRIFENTNQTNLNNTNGRLIWGAGSSNSGGVNIGFQRTDAIAALFPSGGIVSVYCLDSSQLPGLFSQNGVWKHFWISKTNKVAGSFGSSTSSNVAVLSQSYLGIPIYSAGYVEVFLGPEVSPEYIAQPDNNISLPTDVSVISSPSIFCYVSPCSTEGTDGVNPIHMVDQLLFAKFPYGAGRDRSKFDTRSIEAAAEQMQTEKIRGSIAIFDGEGLESALSPILQDAGLMIAWDVSVGKYVFRMIRYEEAGLNIPKDLILKEPAMTAVQGDRPIDVIAFTYKDRDRNYREVPIKIIDSGQIAEYETQRAQKVPVEITKDRDSISRIAPRRQQEGLTNLSSFNFEMNHGCQMAVPGSRFRVTELEGDGIQFLVMNVRRFLNSSKVEIEALVDTYNQPDSFGLADEEGLPALTVTGASATEVVPALLDFQAFELPFGSEISLAFLASRASSKIVKSAVWGSRDGTAYTFLGDGVLAVRGTLAQELPATTAMIHEGPVPIVADLQEDLAQIDDLTLEPAAWRSGRQLMLIGNEIIFLKNGYPDELVGLIRGRFGTSPATYAAGTPFYIVPYHRLTGTKSLMYAAGSTVYYKGQAASMLRSSDITLIDAKTITVSGKAFTPMKPAGLRLESFKTSYPAYGGPLKIVWCYESDEFPNTGLGMQPLGNAVGLSGIQGYFQVTLIDGTSLNKIAVFTTEENEVVMSDLYRGDLGLETISSWIIEVTHVHGAYTSEKSSLTLYPA